MHTLGPWKEDDDHKIGARAIIGDGQQLVALVYGRTPEEQVANVAMICSRPVWQDIDTAPKDGTFILLCVAGAVPAVGQWQKSPWGHEGWKATEPSDFQDDDALLADWENTQWLPTHWQPVPAAPEQ